MFRRSFTITNCADEVIRGDLRYREDLKDAPVVIVCHGFKGFKDWGFFPVLSDSLADDGYVALSFNFSRNGMGADLHNFTELDKFAKNTYTHEIEDLDCIVKAVQAGSIGKGIIDKEKIGLLGHSRGGGIVLLYASNNESIQTVVTWSAISTVERFSPAEIDVWKKNGYIEIENKRTKQIMRMDKDLLDDIRKNKKKLDIINATEKLEIPVLVIHGEADEAVPVNEAHLIHDHLKAESKDLFIIEEGTHTFGIGHPMELRTEQFDTALDLSVSWFDKHLNL